ncbi:MAG: hypothetical protein LBI98_02170 [Endomicrobium sp.]|jgi:3-deoxy-D-manno-octulosonic-acid transferase|nr:hypothetical protein [Endomicrobium sp.]
MIVFVFNNKYNKEIFYKLSERFSFCKLSNKDLKTTLWIHCASLGEVRAVEPILENLKSEYYIILTSFTRSGRDYGQNLQKADFVTLLPLDIYPIMRKFFNIVKPDMLILVETEIWPTLLYVAHCKNVKVITINGRMSSKSFKIYKKFKFFWDKFITLIDSIITVSKDDADRFLFLTDSKSRVAVSGNIKYGKNFILNSKREDFFLSKEDFVFSAGSTREGEEEIIADVFNKISLDFNKIKFFIVPRHLSRIKSVVKILKNKCIEYSLFSSGNFKNRFVLVDVFGKLQSIYSISNVCYVGGSIVDKGGQNPIEPAGYGKPVLFGKNMYNFKTESEILLKFNGALVVNDGEELYNSIKKFMCDKNFLEDIGKNALKAVKSQKSIVSFVIKNLKDNLSV